MAGSPWIVISSIIIEPGASLTIEAGVEVRFNSLTGVDVYGNLTILGTAGATVWLRLNGTPPPGWMGIAAHEDAHLQISHSLFENVEIGFDNPVVSALKTANLSINNVTIVGGNQCIKLDQTVNATLKDISCASSDLGMNSVNTQGTMVRNVSFQFGEGRGLGIQASGDHGFVLDSIVIRTPTSGISIQDATGLSLRNSTVHICDYVSNAYSLRLQNVTDISLLGNVLEFCDGPTQDVKWWPLNLTGVDNLTVEGNAFLSASGGPSVSYRFDFDHSPLVIRNRFEHSVEKMILSGAVLWNDTCSGNYWHDYTGTDWNEDGIGDVPFMIMNGTWDWLPMMREGGCYSPSVPPLRVPPGITRITYEAMDQTSPQIYHNLVMWRDSGKDEEHSYDFGTESYGELPHGGFLFKDRVVDTGGSAITEYQRSTNRSVERYRPLGAGEGDPQTSDRYLIWSYNDILSEAYLSYTDLLTGAIHRNAFWAGWPDYDIDGELVAYSAWTGHFTYPPSCEEVRLSSLRDGWTHQVTYFNEVGGDSCPPGARYQMSHVHMAGGSIVFQVDYWTSWTEPPTWFSQEVYLYSIPDDTLTQISPEGAWAYSPDVSDGWAVWLDNSTGDSDIVLLNLTNWKTYRIPRPGEQMYPRIYENIITWQDQINGTWQIFVANLSFIVVDIDAIPNPQITSAPLSIRATVLNVRPTVGVWVEIRKPSGGILENASMVDDGGGACHYTGTYSETGTYTFKVSAVDDRGSWVSENGTFDIRDTSGPRISSYGANPAVQEAGGSVNVTAIVTDESAVAGVWLNVSDPSGGTSNNTMTSSPGDEYYVNSSYVQLGTYVYTIAATDPSDNWDSVAGTFRIVDSSPPEIISVNVDPNPGELHMPVNISATVTDNLHVTSVTLYIAGPGVNGNWPMVKGLSDGWFLSQSYDSVGLHDYRIVAQDSSGNAKESSGSFSIVDSDSPVISSLVVLPDPVRVFSPVEIGVSITDDDSVYDVTAQVLLPDSSTASFPLTRISGDTYHAYFATSVIGRHVVTVKARDPSLNEATSLQQFYVVDDLPPVVSVAVARPGVQEVYGFVNITATVTDNYMLAAVLLNVIYPSGTWTNATMLTAGSNDYYLARAYGMLGAYSFVVSACDSSGQWASESGTFRIVDTTPPIAEAGQDVVVENGSTVLFNASLSSDNYLIGDYRWSFDYGGSHVTLFGETAMWTFGNEGVYTVGLRVTDMSGNNGTDDMQVTVQPQNKRPWILTIGIDPRSPEYRQVATFTARVVDTDVDRVWLEVWNPDGSPLFNRTMNWDPASGLASNSSSFARLGQFAYRVSVVDLAGLWDAMDGSFLVVDTTPPEALAGADRTVERGQPVELNAGASTDNVLIIDYEWRWSVDGSPIFAEGPVVNVVFGKPGVYQITLAVEDSSHNVGHSSVIITVEDTIPPSTPTGLTGFVVSGGVLLLWTPNTEDDLAGYHLYRENASGVPKLLASFGPLHIQYIDSDVVNGTTYNYTLRALDLYGHASAQSEKASVNIPLPPSERPPVQTQGFDYAWLLLIPLALLAAAFTILYLRRRGREPQSKGNREEKAQKGEPPENEQEPDEPAPT